MLIIIIIIITREVHLEFSALPFILSSLHSSLFFHGFISVLFVNSSIYTISRPGRKPGIPGEPGIPGFSAFFVWRFGAFSGNSGNSRFLTWPYNMGDRKLGIPGKPGIPGTFILHISFIPGLLILREILAHFPEIPGFRPGHIYGGSKTGNSRKTRKVI